ncbi:MAG TPA: SRPBCC family protein [Gemmatimonadaceae bacterium]|nr:SRPBCC family protein [Gemmatimonadaceae bacterium]
MKTRDLHQTVSFAAPPATVYRALMNSRQHSRVTGSRAIIGARAGSRFSVWDGAISGITLSLVPGKQIVQAWRSEDWPEGHYSIATFTFRRAGRGTRLTFDQYGVPANKYRGIADGWKSYYWRSMKSLLEK